MSGEDKKLADYLQSVTDTLCGQPSGVQIDQPGMETAPPAAKMEEKHLRRVWKILDLLSPPEPEDALMDRLFQQVMVHSGNRELGDDELDMVVGAVRAPEAEDAALPGSPGECGRTTSSDSKPKG